VSGARWTTLSRFAALRLAALPLGALGVAWLMALAPLHAQLSAGVDDAMLRATAPTAPFHDVALIDFDDGSLAALQPRLGPWPYKRDVYAALVDFLRDAGARAIVFDIVFGEPRDGDAAFARTIAKRPDVVLAAAAVRDQVEQRALVASSLDRVSAPSLLGGPITRWPAVTLPTSELLAPLSQVGSVGVITTTLDADGKLRRLPLLHGFGSGSLPSLALAALLIEFQGEPPMLEILTSEVRWGQHRWPIDAQAMARLALPGNAADIPSLPASTVLRAALGEIDAARVRSAVLGRTVFIGSSAFLSDSVVTPQGQLSGAAVLASAYEALRRDDVIRAASWPLDAALIGIALLPCLLVAHRGRAAVLRDGAAAGAALVFIVAAAVVVLHRYRVLASPLLPLTIVVVGFVLSALLQVRWTARANQALRDERLTAQAANAAKSEFLAGVSHELRTPLHAVLGMADALSSTPLNPEQRRYVEVFRNAGSTLASLIDDLLDLSRIEASRLTLDLQPFAMRDLLAAQMALFEPRASAKGLTLSLQVLDGIGPAVIGDAKRFAQVLVNLVGNAIKFTQLGGVAITIEREPQGLVHVRIADTGIGIARSRLKMIFEPFTQADGSVTRDYGGTGLGLAITKQLVTLMGGQVWVESEPGLGSTFHFTADMPITDRPTEAAAASTGSTLAAPPGGQPTAVRILLAEDNDVNVLVVEAMLKGSAHSLDIAANGETAVEMFRANNYGLVLMDVHMPGMGGYAATRAIRDFEAEQGRAPTPILALTASAFASDRIASAAAGCTGHLAKPLGQQQLLDAISKHGVPRGLGADPAGVPRGIKAARALPEEARAGRLAGALDQHAALLHAGGDEVRRQRNFEHAKVFLVGWRRSFDAAVAASDVALQQALGEDLRSVAMGVGAHQLAVAAGSLVAALASSTEPIPVDAVSEVEHHLQEVIAAASKAGE
jgi:signal transduction histidine kinase/DNA-binding response OmpR family regulator